MGKELDVGYYNLYSPDEEKPVLAHLYDNPDAKRRGFGFNTSDGAGFLPLSDLSPKSRVVPVKIVEG